MSNPQHPRCLDLLRLQADAALDHRGRIVDCYGVTIASCEDGQALWIGADVPDATAGELTAAFERARPPRQPTEPPPALEVCEQILTSGGALERTGGPSYLIPSDARCDCDAAIVSSGSADAVRFQRANPGNWHPVEWDELLAGRLGPWTMIVGDQQAISICHTPGPFTEQHAECGVWTDPRFRGRGYAAATAAAWVALLRSPGRSLFYSTDADNLSSQRVAQRLNAREIGWTWRLQRDRREHGVRVHPLCSLHPGAGT